MTLQPWVADDLEAAGLTVLRVSGWETRQTRVGFTPQGVVAHDTVTAPGMTRLAEQNILRYGREDLAGPLAQLGVHRDGVVSVIAAGRCNHNGYGMWGNDAWGIEVFCYGGQPGHEEPYNVVQSEVVAQASAVLCRHHGWDFLHVRGHKETDPDRKIDPFGTDMAAMRWRVAALVSGVPPIPPPTLEDDVLEFILVLKEVGYPLLLGRELDSKGAIEWQRNYDHRVRAQHEDPLYVLTDVMNYLESLPPGS